MRTPVIASILAAAILSITPAAADDAPAAPAPPPAAYGPRPYPLPYPMWPPPLPMERRSRGMWISGIVLFAAGGAANIVGGVLTGIIIGSPCIETVADGGPAPAPRPAALRERVGTSRQALGGCGNDGIGVAQGLLAGGLLTSLLGVPLFVIGNKRVPARPASLEDAALPEVHLGAGNGSLTWRF
jgi:hypothetical protein